ncbi:hypothetical protein ACFRCQ_08370 [Cytobacillus firmus]|uniref:hypothetical protein n=1 Tax=Cytobacillus firmus TaxID=1399 RepID=UPI0036868105
MSEREQMYIEIGLTAKALAELHLRKPEEFTAEYILTSLLEAYDLAGFKQKEKQ